MSQPPIEPWRTGLLPVADGSRLYWEASGNPAGKAVLYLHGGPGSGLRSGDYRHCADPERHLIVGLDQRGCGRSRPLATESPAALATNTTAALIADLEALRRHLNIGRWLVTGLSWGSTLALAYAQAHPDRVSELVLSAVTTTSREEVDWVTEGVGRIFPEAWERFAAAALRRADERIVEAYARRLAGPDATDRLAAAQAWNEWESVHVAFDCAVRDPGRQSVDAGSLLFATLVTRYWAHDAFLPGDSAVLPRVGRIAHIPATLIHGRRDISGPLVTPWRLHKLWPASELVILDTGGHGGTEAAEEVRRAIDGFGDGGRSQPHI